jgi:catechol 2,3-dioxygenase-like lactoylglutathione lyase family enzyme
MLTGINHITISVRDLEESFSFYRDILGFSPVMKSCYSAYFLCGTTWIALQEEKEKNHSTDRYSHVAFDIEGNNYSAFVANLRRHKIPEWQENSTQGNSYYFCDPSGNRFEIHVSSIEARIKHGKETWKDDVTWFV